MGTKEKGFYTNFFLNISRNQGNLFVRDMYVYACDVY